MALTGGKPQAARQEPALVAEHVCTRTGGTSQAVKVAGASATFSLCVPEGVDKKADPNQL